MADSTTSSSHFPNVVQLIQNSYIINNEKISNTECLSSQYNDYKMNLHLDHLPQTPSFDLNQSSSQSSLSPASNTDPIREHMSDEYRPNCDSLATNSSIKECNNCFSDRCLDPKNHFLPNIEAMNSQEMQFTNKCMVITDGSVESIKNRCIESFGAFSTNSNNSETNKSVIHYNKKDEIPDKVYQKVIELEFATIPIKDMLHNLSNEEFNKYESQKISELSEAVTAFNNNHHLDHIKITAEFTNLLDATKLLAMKCDEAIRRLVIMSKKISAFKSLCQHDQIALMKACCFEILIMRSIVSYNSENEYWPITLVRIAMFNFKII